MQECISTVSDFGDVRERVCINARKIMDACRDQDCMEDVTVYLTAQSQETLETATSVKARCAELLYADVSVEELGYQDGYFCCEIQYYYRVIADAVLCAVRPAAIYGLAVFNKRVSLYGGEAVARSFSSDGSFRCGEKPIAVVDAIDPVVLCAKINENCGCNSGRRPAPCPCNGLPEPVAEAFDDELIFNGMNRTLTVTLGQFSLVRLERDTQLLIPSYDYCMPQKACCDHGGCCQESPCDTFAKMSFPVQAFFPESDGELCTSCGRNGGRSGTSEAEDHENCGRGNDRTGSSHAVSTGSACACGTKNR